MNRVRNRGGVFSAVRSKFSENKDHLFFSHFGTAPRGRLWHRFRTRVLNLCFVRLKFHHWVIVILSFFFFFFIRLRPHDHLPRRQAQSTSFIPRLRKMSRWLCRYGYGWQHVFPKYARVLLRSSLDDCDKLATKDVFAKKFASAWMPENVVICSV